jgi:RimJ/RimL family protein N-acetyltransferase
MTDCPVALVPLEAEHSRTFFEWINDRDLVSLSAAYRPVHEEAHQRWFSEIQSRPDVVVFGIRELSSGALVGSAQLLNISPVHRSGELQIRIGDGSGRNRGLGTAAVKLLVRFAFEDLNVRRVYLHVFASNEPAIRAYEKAGFEEEGRMREAVYVDGQYVDVIIMALMKANWGKGS